MYRKKAGMVDMEKKKHFGGGSDDEKKKKSDGHLEPSLWLVKKY